MRFLAESTQLDDHRGELLMLRHARGRATSYSTPQTAIRARRFRMSVATTLQSHGGDDECSRAAYNNCARILGVLRPSDGLDRVAHCRTVARGPPLIRRASAQGPQEPVSCADARAVRSR